MPKQEAKTPEKKASATKNLKPHVKDISAQKQAVKVPSQKTPRKVKARASEPAPPAASANASAASSEAATSCEATPLKTYDEFYGASAYEESDQPAVPSGSSESKTTSEAENSEADRSADAQELEEWYRLTESGAAAFDNERYAVAELCFVDALKIVDKPSEQATLSNEEKVRVTKSLNNLAALYHVQGKYSMAEDLYERCLDMKLALYGEEHLEVAVNLHNLAVLHSAKRSFLRAEILYKRALEVREKLLGSMHAELVPILKNYALLLKKTRRELEAFQIEERVKWIQGHSS